jgi:stress response protein YsnF
MPSTPSHPQDQGPDDTLDATTSQATGDETIRLPLTEEILEAHIVERERGALRIHRRVETEPVVAAVDLQQDRYVVDRVQVNELADERREPWYEGNTLVVPVYEEVLVSETKLMLREVVRLQNAGGIEQINLTGTVRRDVVDIEEIDREGHVSRPEDAR